VIGNSAIVANVGSETSLDITYLYPGIDYYFDVFSYAISNGSYDYVTVNPLEGVQRTTSNGSPSARVSADRAPKLSNQYSEHPTGNDNHSPFPNPFSDMPPIHRFLSRFGETFLATEDSRDLRQTAA